MISMEGYTASEIADILGIKLKTAKKRIETTGIKPLTHESLYPKEILELVKNAPPRGRPHNKPL
jgi:hypothetical protein